MPLGPYVYQATDAPGDVENTPSRVGRAWLLSLPQAFAFMTQVKRFILSPNLNFTLLILAVGTKTLRMSSHRTAEPFSRQSQTGALGPQRGFSALSASAAGSLAGPDPLRPSPTPRPISLLGLGALILWLTGLLMSTARSPTATDCTAPLLSMELPPGPVTSHAWGLHGLRGCLGFCLPSQIRDSSKHSETSGAPL